MVRLWISLLLTIAGLSGTKCTFYEKKSFFHNFLLPILPFFCTVLIQLFYSTMLYLPLLKLPSVRGSREWTQDCVLQKWLGIVIAASWGRLWSGSERIGVILPDSDLHPGPVDPNSAPDLYPYNANLSPVHETTFGFSTHPRHLCALRDTVYFQTISFFTSE